MLKKIIACFAFAMLGVFALVGSNRLEDSKREPLNKKDIVLDDDEDNDISFELDSEGNRIKKTIYYSYDNERESYEEVHNYYFDGDLLIIEITPQY